MELIILINFNTNVSYSAEDNEPAGMATITIHNIDSVAHENNTEQNDDEELYQSDTMPQSKAKNKTNVSTKKLSKKATFGII